MHRSNTRHREGQSTREVGRHRSRRPKGLVRPTVCPTNSVVLPTARVRRSSLWCAGTDG
jgi:hypothetical protein